MFQLLRIWLFIYSNFCFTGFVIGKKSSSKRKASDKSEESPSNWEMKAKFQNVTLWNHDSLPSQDDPFLRSFHWLAVAKAVSFYLTDRALYFLHLRQLYQYIHSVTSHAHRSQYHIIENTVLLPHENLCMFAFLEMINASLSYKERETGVLSYSLPPI